MQRGRGGVTAESGQNEDAQEDERVKRALRKRGRIGPSLLIGAVIAGVGLGAWSLIVPRGPARRGDRMEMEEGSVPTSVAPPRHSDEEGQMGTRRRSRARTHEPFGTEGPAPAQAEEPAMAREEAREAAANAGVIGILKAQTGEWRGKAAPADADDRWLTHPKRADGRRVEGNDPTSRLGKLMGDRVGRAFGLGLSSAHEAKSKPDTKDASEHGEHDAKKENERGVPRKDRELDDLLDAAVAKATARPRPVSQARTIAVPRILPSTPTAQPASPPVATSVAEQLLARYGTLENLRFIDANGYFENTYVPGDPTMRALQARLRGYDRKLLLPDAVRGARLDDGSQRNAQPFDPPAHAALGVYLSASERGLTGARRMLVQVGLQATPRYSGRRPAMNIGLVLDAREPLDGNQSATVRALLAAFADARDLGDKLTLFAAGPGGGELVRAEDFRHGPLTVALQRVLAERGAPSVGLRDTVQRALQRVRGGDDPSAPLGSSVVILIAPRAIGGELAELVAIAHQSAVDGIPLSAFGVGQQAAPDELARLALAGQGNRRMLTAGGDASAAVDRELSAVARVVARAVRLRIRLAPGTRLVSVLGSRSLDAQQAQRVREAENSIDQRISKNLGIERDRGEDEEGVQIVIPSFYAGDSHTVLLDVVADGPGPVADVTVRFKDLVQLGNGVARESLWLPNLELARGALQRNVLKNLVAFEVARELRQAGDALAAGDGVGAGRTVAQALALLESVGRAIPELHGDRELEADRSLVAEYVALLSGIDRAALRNFAADSLHFASLMKLQPRPEWDARAE